MYYLWIIFGAVAVYYFYKHVYKPTKYWKEKNIPYIPAIPLLGSWASNIFTLKLSRAEIITKMYNLFPNAKYIGLHQFSTSILILRDLELIKQVTVKHYDSFIDHTLMFNEEVEPLFGRSLFALKGQRWKDMRSTLSPAFTGSKMRIMFQFIKECAEQFVEYFDGETKETGTIEIEMKDAFTRYANDVIATTAFGIKCDSLKDKENDFYMIGKASTSFNFFRFIQFTAYLIFPRLLTSLGVKLGDQKVSKYFSDIILSTLRFREKENIVRPDMIHLLMEAQKGRLKHETTTKTTEEDNSFSAVDESSLSKTTSNNKICLTDQDIISQAFLFFFAGYDTTSSMLGLLSYELALNPDIQKRLQNEIDETVADKKLDYESILKMKYLDMVVSEALRKWPLGVAAERQCTNPYLIETPGEEPLLVEKDVSIWIPTFAIHRDPKYYSEPEKFDPERFNDENKINIQPFTYMPFGVGPRNCIGSRFALLEVKTLIVYILSKFDFTVIKKTQIPFVYDPMAFNIAAKKGIWLGLKVRSQN